MLVPDVRKQILVINQKAREGEKKQLEAEKLQKLNEMVMPKLMVIKKRDDGCVKILKVSSMICVVHGLLTLLKVDRFKAPVLDTKQAYFVILICHGLCKKLIHLNVPCIHYLS
ncbi:uncharacterized protein LOC131315977 isoform X1 [Rhododendron vialii]|uniref:uncharacterized protein LOC131315977 isoform X1 n=1 Tax=Rhododendron vialii TaxID=182163 RepID=UPI00265EE947|nr:uncharacterized protein LOC131315977 isoform X1 [Rhododendron vialii]